MGLADGEGEELVRLVIAGTGAGAEQGRPLGLDELLGACAPTTAWNS